METAVQITFEDVTPSEALDAAIREELAALRRYFEDIVSAHVTVSEPHRHQHSGGVFRVKVRLAVPRDILVIDHEHGRHASHSDPYIAVREAFHAARRELEDYVRRLRVQVKQHEEPPHGRITRLVPWEDCGFIETPDGRELYFHRNSLLHERFDALRVGDVVSFQEEPAEKGANAKSVRVVTRQHQPQRAPGAQNAEVGGPQ